MSGAFWNLCPVSPKHGYLRIVKTDNGGLLAVCAKCYVPVKGRANHLEVKHD